MQDSKDKLTIQKQRAQIRQLKAELAQAQELLHAIQQGTVDAFVVGRKGEQQVFTLEGAERPFRTVVENMNEGAATLTDDGLILYCNQRFAEILELAVNNVLGRNITEFLTTENALTFKQMTKGCYHCQIRGELNLTTSGGKEIAVYAALSPLEGQEIASVSLVVTDISDLKRKNKELLGEALRAGQVVAFEWDRSTDVVIRSENAPDLFGFDAVKGTGAEYFSLVHPDDRPVLNKAISEMKAHRGEYRKQYRLKLPNGQLKWVEDVAKGIFDQNGILLRLHGLMVDITERKQAEEALQETEQRFRIAQEFSPDGFTIFRPVRDAQGHVIDFTWIYENAAIAQMNGTDPKSVIGRRLLDLFPGHRGSPFLEAYQQVAQTGAPRILEAPYHGDSISTLTWFRVAVVSMGTDIAVLAQDITPRKRAEEQLREVKKPGFRNRVQGRKEE